MADELWSKEAFAGGYSSGTVVGPLREGDPETELRLFEDKRIGGSLSAVFRGRGKAIPSNPIPVFLNSVRERVRGRGPFFRR